jgi:signal peptidase I
MRRRKKINFVFLFFDLIIAGLVGLVLFCCIANYFPTGLKFALVEGISMQPFYYSGDIIVFKEDPNREAIKVGDIITYFDKETESGIVHRVIDIKRSSDLSFLIKGDNNGYQDGWIPAGRIDGKIIHSLKTRYIYSYPSLFLVLIVSLLLFFNNKYKSSFREIVLCIAIFLSLRLLYEYFMIYTDIFPDLIPW